MNRKNREIWSRGEFERISELIKNKSELNHYLFLRIRNFKIQSFSPEEEENIQKVTKIAFEYAKKDETEKAIQELRLLGGVGIPIASTILAMKFPEKYCIIDRRVLLKINNEKWLKEHTENPKVYSEYLEYMKQKAKEKGMALRQYELSLWEN